MSSIEHSQHDPALLGEFDSVVRKIDQDLSDALRIAEQTVRKPRCNGDGKCQAFRIRLLRNQTSHIIQHGFERKLANIDPELARLDLRQIEDIVHDAQQVLARCLYAPDVMADTRIGIHVRGQVAHTDDGIQRGANFVAHVGQEFRLGPAGLFCEVTRGGQLPGAQGDLVFQRLGQFFQIPLRSDQLRDIERDHADGDHRSVVFPSNRKAHRTVGLFAAVFLARGVITRSGTTGTQHLVMFLLPFGGFLR